MCEWRSHAIHNPVSWGDAPRTAERATMVSQSFFVDVTSNARTMIDHPIDVVWPHLLNQESWMKDLVIERIGANRDTEGEIKKVIPVLSNARDLGVKEVEPFFFKTLLLIPFRRFVY